MRRGPSDAEIKEYQARQEWQEVHRLSGVIGELMRTRLVHIEYARSLEAVAVELREARVLE